MPRRIVLVGKGESLHRAWQSRSFGLASAELERLLHVAGFALDDTYHPVRVAGRLGPAAERPAPPGFRYARSGGGAIDSYEIGRGAWRGRGEISGVAVSLKKKRIKQTLARGWLWERRNQIE